MTRFIAVCLPSLLLSCTGEIGEASGTSDQGATPPGKDNSGPGAGAATSQQPSLVLVPRPKLARLGWRQWSNAMKDLLKLPSLGGVENDLTKDAVLGFDNEASALFVTETLRVDYQRAAEQLARKVTGDPAALARLVPAGAPRDPAGRARAFIQGFGLRAYRRPLEQAEVEEYVGLFEQGPKLIGGADPFVAGVELVLQLFLQSPHFLYRTELSTAVSDGRIRLTSYEVASKLSFALTDTMPDEALFQAAAADALRTRADLRAHATRLLASPRGIAMVDHFHEQVLGMGAYDTLAKDPTLFPTFAPARDSLREEALRFTRWVTTNDRGVKDLFTAPVTFVNASLARIYGLGGRFTDDFTQVDLDPSRRAGVLTRLGFLAANAKSTMQDSIRRGVFINRRILCNSILRPKVELPPAPPVTAAKTNREQIEARTGKGTCGESCHAQFINPAGFAFENFDAIGRYRTTENRLPINAADAYPFDEGVKTFNGPVEFSRLLGDSAQAHGCYGQQWIAYVHGRTIVDADKPVVQALMERSRGGGMSINEMILSLATDDSFLMRPL